MKHKITCARCQNLLVIEADSRTTGLTCPRCLAPVPNPALAVTTVKELKPSVASLSDDDDGAECFGCGKSIKNDWRYCPYCDAELRRPRRQPAADTDAEVRFDLSIAGGGLVGLGFLGTCGVFAYLIHGGAFQQLEVVLGVLGGMFLVVMVGVGLALGGRNAAASGSVGVLGGLTLMLIILGLPFALCLGFLNACHAPHALLLWTLLFWRSLPSS